MAAITPTVSRTPEGNMTDPLSNKRMFRHSFTLSSTVDTWQSGLGGGVVEYAIANLSGGLLIPSNNDGLFGFVGSTGFETFDLLVWTDN